MIKAVVFDIDGVLIDSFEANFKFFQDLFNKAGYKPPTRKEFQPLFPVAMRDMIKIVTKASEKEVHRMWEMGRTRSVPYPNHLIKVPKGIEKTIRMLSKDYLLGLATSRVKEGIYTTPILKSLQEYFQIAISYQDTVNHKPHPEPLLLASQKLNINPSEAVYIGDVENDIIAGKAAGMKVILYNKIRTKGADLYTSTFTELPELIKKLH